VTRVYSTVTVVLMGAFALAGCGGESSSGVAWQGTVDTVAGVEVVANPAEPMHGGADAWRLEEELNIGVIEGDPDYQFGAISDLVVDESGDIYVLDGQARRVMVYDSAGTFLRAFGRQGEGPGEFEAPATMVWKADTLVVWDWRLQRLSYFDRDGALLRDQRLEVPFGFRQFRFRPDGRLWTQLGPTWSMPIRPEEDGVGKLLIFDPADQSADTVMRWKNEAAVPIRSENFMTLTFTRYAPHLSWTADDDANVYVARGHEFEIEVYSPAGEHVRSIRREYSRFPPSEAERDSARAQHDRQAERFGEQADRYRKAFAIADRKLATAAMIVSDDGFLWVQVHTAEDIGSLTWNVFDPAGRFVASLQTPARLAIHKITGPDLYAAFRDELDVPHVKRFEILRPDEAAGAS